MASTRDIKRKIKSVHSMQQITRAMNLVAAAKLQRARGVLNDVRPFSERTKSVIASIVKRSKGIRHAFIDEREEVKNTLVIAIASDKGLCGGFNSNISKETVALINEKPNVQCITVGNKIKDYLMRRRLNVTEHIAGVSDKPDYGLAAKIGRSAVSKFLSGEVDEVYICYTRFVSTIAYEPTIFKVLPVDTSQFDDIEISKAQMIFEPSEEEVLDDVIPKYVNIAIYGALVESSASQQGARMTAMDSATENASEMIDKYTLLYNRARQSAITQEITEIVGGADALS